jgi:hypothetical protein
MVCTVVPRHKVLLVRDSLVNVVSENREEAMRGNWCQKCVSVGHNKQNPNNWCQKWDKLISNLR